MHDLCMHWAHGVSDKRNRNHCGHDCDKRLGDCANNAGGGLKGRLLGGVFGGFTGGVITPHALFGTKLVSTIPSDGIFDPGMPWTPPAGPYPPQGLIDPFDPSPNDPDGGCGHGIPTTGAE
jgi:hypothetical protein